MKLVLIILLVAIVAKLLNAWLKSDDDEFEQATKRGGKWVDGYLNNKKKNK